MKHNQFQNITKNATKTFYNAILLFPKEVRDDVFILYSFLRIADDLIDASPPKIKEFQIYKSQTYDSLKKKHVDNPVINAFGELALRKKIKAQLITDFFASLEIDLKRKKYQTFEELREFTYGVAEVVGILMAIVMNLPKKSHACAQKLGLAMQLVNIMRDIDEDRELGRVYIPQEELKLYKLPSSLTLQDVKNNPKEFNALMQFQINRINQLFDEAHEGFQHIPRQFLIPITAASDIYYQTAKTIKKNPVAIFYKKVRLSKLSVMMILFKNYIKVNVTI